VELDVAALGARGLDEQPERVVEEGPELGVLPELEEVEVEVSLSLEVADVALRHRPRR
jgi:hypothetical protein